MSTVNQTETSLLPQDTIHQGKMKVQENDSTPYTTDHSAIHEETSRLKNFKDRLSHLEGEVKYLKEELAAGIEKSQTQNELIQKLKEQDEVFEAVTKKKLEKAKLKGQGEIETKEEEKADEAVSKTEEAETKGIKEEVDEGNKEAWKEEEVEGVAGEVETSLTAGPTTSELTSTTPGQTEGPSTSEKDITTTSGERIGEGSTEEATPQGHATGTDPARDRNAKAGEGETGAYEGDDEMTEDDLWTLDEEYVGQMKENYQNLEEAIKDVEKFLEVMGYQWVSDGNMLEISQGRFIPMMTTFAFDEDYKNVIVVQDELINGQVKPQVAYFHQEKNNVVGLDTMDLTLYRNGLQLENNSFHEYESDSVREFFLNFRDGYYPLHVRNREPSTVMFKIVDKRNETKSRYKDYTPTYLRAGQTPVEETVIQSHKPKIQGAASMPIYTQTTTRVVQQTIPQSSTPPGTYQMVTQVVPQALNQVRSQPVSQGVPQTMTQVVPQTMTQGVPQTMTQGVPQMMTQVVPQTITQAVPKPITQTLPQQMIQVVPQTMTQAAPQPMNQTQYPGANAPRNMDQSKPQPGKGPKKITVRQEQGNQEYRPGTDQYWVNKESDSPSVPLLAVILTEKELEEIQQKWGVEECQVTPEMMEQMQNQFQRETGGPPQAAPVIRATPGQPQNQRNMATNQKRVQPNQQQVIVEEFPANQQRMLQNQQQRSQVKQQQIPPGPYQMQPQQQTPQRMPQNQHQYTQTQQQAVPNQQQILLSPQQVPPNRQLELVEIVTTERVQRPVHAMAQQQLQQPGRVVQTAQPIPGAQVVTGPQVIRGPQGGQVLPGAQVQQPKIAQGTPQSQNIPPRSAANEGPPVNITVYEGPVTVLNVSSSTSYAFNKQTSNTNMTVKGEAQPGGGAWRGEVDMWNRDNRKGGGRQRPSDDKHRRNVGNLYPTEKDLKMAGAKRKSYSTGSDQRTAKVVEKDSYQTEYQAAYDETAKKIMSGGGPKVPMHPRTPTAEEKNTMFKYNAKFDHVAFYGQSFVDEGETVEGIQKLAASDPEAVKYMRQASESHGEELNKKTSPSQATVKLKDNDTGKFYLVHLNPEEPLKKVWSILKSHGLDYKKLTPEIPIAKKFEDNGPVINQISVEERSMKSDFNNRKSGTKSEQRKSTKESLSIGSKGGSFDRSIGKKRRSSGSGKGSVTASRGYEERDAQSPPKLEEAKGSHKSSEHQVKSALSGSVGSKMFKELLNPEGLLKEDPEPIVTVKWSIKPDDPSSVAVIPYLKDAKNEVKEGSSSALKEASGTAVDAKTAEKADSKIVNDKKPSISHQTSVSDVSTKGTPRLEKVALIPKSPDIDTTSNKEPKPGNVRTNKKEEKDSIDEDDDNDDDNVGDDKNSVETEKSSRDSDKNSG